MPPPRRHGMVLTADSWLEFRGTRGKAGHEGILDVHTCVGDFSRPSEPAHGDAAGQP
ncbi:MAG TPA: hypothetical protein VE733_00235 [Streptosporangiaceae bacterium]|nr:hypothetical protein [Streptosporangiaceae bacterium]